MFIFHAKLVDENEDLWSSGFPLFGVNSSNYWYLHNGEC